MKVYVLTINEKSQDPHIMHSNFIAPRYPRKVEYYASAEGAKARKDEILDGIRKLVGFIGNIDVWVEEQELMP